MSLGALLQLLSTLVPNDQECNRGTEGTSAQRYDICRFVALYAVDTGPTPILPYDGMGIEHRAVEDIEYVAADDRRECHEAPVLGKTVDAEGLGNDGRKHPKEEPITQSAETRYETKEVRIGDVEREYLRKGEDTGRDHETPDSTSMEDFDKEVGPNAYYMLKSTQVEWEFVSWLTTQKPSGEAANG